MKVCSKCGDEICTKDGENLCPACDNAEMEGKRAAKKAKAALSRKERESVMRSLGLVKVRGAMGGTYWE